ncbi:iron ABC transporter permease [Gammaproteobacteria bacterium ESL0073]|nr:iron ABC transporter permease [Gammaproteobacteria bacterium ESL0073]
MASHRDSRLFKLLLPPIILLLLCVIACCVGQYGISLSELAHSITQYFFSTADKTDIDTVLWDIRIPRIGAAILVGAALSMAGATYQGMFRNPLVSPDVLGVTAGAGLGAVMAIYFDLSFFLVQVMAFSFALLAVFIAYLVAKLARHHDPILSLVLSGVAIGALFGSAIALVKILADPYGQLATMVFWMLGALNMVNREDLLMSTPIILLCMVPLVLLRWRMNILSLDDKEALSLGVNVNRTRIVFILSATLMTATAVSITGVIGWIGLVVPHMARLWVGPDFRKLLPTSLFIGAAFLVLTDTIARTCFPIELPLGIITAFVGVPFFLSLLIRGGVRK